MTDKASPAFTPFARGDSRALVLTAADERLVVGKPAPLRVLVPVTIEEEIPARTDADPHPAA
jgi:hypothetical protein